MDKTKIKILMVEDNFDQRDLSIEAIHANIPSVEITEAVDGQSALIFLEKIILI